MFNLIISLFFCVWHLSKGIKILSTGTEIDSTLLMFCTKICNERQSYTLITLPTDIDGITLKLKISHVYVFYRPFYPFKRQISMLCFIALKSVWATTCKNVEHLQ